ncbi:MAG: hypothetical protein CMJ35_11220 [Phycisphaerae bacterium]|nr:hypothetical protein [Phycisphaerae bacterium]MBM92162.1 hypothetical protein [Phycisphaerae bacterium]|tara:strand:- start:309 stop:1025 length:717 start_codon:yes stop_codon:yes gene_type:complete
MSNTNQTMQLYNDGADELLNAESFPDRVSLLPAEHGAPQSGSRIRVLWGQDLLADVLDGRYRAVICGVNDQDNSHGVIAQIVSLLTTSQWSSTSVTSYAKMFQESIQVHASNDREPYILKYDLDSVLLLAVLRPRGREYFTVGDMARGFKTISKMLQGRADRRPVCSVSFLGANSNKLVIDDANQHEPSFETVLQTMHDAGYRGDVYPSPQMWNYAHIGVFPSYPYPKGIDRMRAGSS